MNGRKFQAGDLVKPRHYPLSRSFIGRVLMAIYYDDVPDDAPTELWLHKDAPAHLWISWPAEGGEERFSDWCRADEMEHIGVLEEMARQP